MRTVAAVVALVACVHAGLWALMRDNAHAPDFDGQLASVSYAPFKGSAHPDSGTKAQAAQIRSDLKLLAPLTRAIRTYSATSGVELVPGIASEFGLRVTAGAWIDKNQDRNEREIRSVIELAKRHSNINGIIVGNETIYRDEQKVSDLIQMIQRVKRSTSVPVTTGEIWHVWIEHPELVSERICRFAGLVGKENVMAASDCGFGTGATSNRVYPPIVYAKLAAMSEGARLATQRLWPK